MTTTKTASTNRHTVRHRLRRQRRPDARTERQGPDRCQAGRAVSLDTYEQTVNTMLDFSQKAADSTKVDWVSALAKSQASIISEFTNTYTKAARDLLK